MKIALRRESTGFIPDSQHDWDEAEAIHIGDVVMTDMKKSRNPGHHRKGFALLKRLFDNQDTFTDFERFREWLQIAAGIVDTIIGPDGETYYKVRSLAWHNMDQAQFEKTYQAIVTVAYERLGAEWALVEFG